MLLGCGLHFFLFVIIGDPNLLYFTRCREFSNVRGKTVAVSIISVISVLFGMCSLHGSGSCTVVCICHVLSVH